MDADAAAGGGCPIPISADLCCSLRLEGGGMARGVRAPNGGCWKRRRRGSARSAGAAAAAASRGRSRRAGEEAMRRSGGPAGDAASRSSGRPRVGWKMEKLRSIIFSIARNREATC